ncbi:MAG: hypothetical protein Q8S13_13510, partial [Dehalococcoidia bacterium]|nr:hypothetical protein [Dehalococcoidia bacterium]
LEMDRVHALVDGLRRDAGEVRRVALDEAIARCAAVEQAGVPVLVAGARICIDKLVALRDASAPPPPMRSGSSFDEGRVAGLREALAGCVLCGGTGWQRDREGRPTANGCPRCLHIRRALEAVRDAGAPPTPNPHVQRRGHDPDPTCATCGEAWPCAGATEKESGP